MLDIWFKPFIMWSMQFIPACFTPKKESKKSNRHPHVVW